MENLNLIQKIMKKHNVGYSEIAKNTGYTYQTIAKSCVNNKMSKPLEKALQLYETILDMNSKDKSEDISVEYKPLRVTNKTIYKKRAKVLKTIKEHKERKS